MAADTPFSPGQIHRATAPSSSMGSNSSLGRDKATGTAMKTGSSLQEDVVQSQAIFVQGHLPLSQPLCLECERPVTRLTTSRYNRNGNARRPYLKCVPCDKFHSFADEQGNNPENLRCHCGEPSRKQVSGIKTQSQRGLHYVCSLGNCDFYRAAIGPSGHQVLLDERLPNQMRTLGLV
ncbi:uncharacterized protein BDZ99DRAFT_465379 [Mytilinidion resinicola]|uniref:GRF-like zinc ribbon domain-containing protein n=1 Tax=Mytilinidion resinicola TaxID=574789 RepID=A0A6A6YHQ5_9PEZI|nr:uncharacterized protein BDZ99DRAFT_465379 [Mytilinidion resinicola]KAF2807534.1 hypothetical protein BDZ99DRAFT_465379 [Mytilinidion resinicola]